MGALEQQSSKVPTASLHEDCVCDYFQSITVSRELNIQLLSPGSPAPSPGSAWGQLGAGGVLQHKIRVVKRVQSTGKKNWVHCEHMHGEAIPEPEAAGGVTKTNEMPREKNESQD